MKINALIVDDEPIARAGMEEYAADVSCLNIVGTCDSAVKAYEWVASGTVDLLFLDIQMPRLTGLDFLKTLKNPPMVILTTAYPQYALESFALDVLDYLVKPIPFDRFLKAVNKAKELFDLKQNQTMSDLGFGISNSGGFPKSDVRNPKYTEGVLPTIGNDYFFIKTESKYERIAFADVLFIEALQNYVVIHTTTGRHTVYLTLKSVESYLPQAQFLKVQKSFIVALGRIEGIEGADILIGKHRIPISRQDRDGIMDVILKDKLLKR
jgi:DNA-binding LytR/AlgR family response regulator